MYAYWQLHTSSQKLYYFYFSPLIACEFYNLICYRRVWQLGGFTIGVLKSRLPAYFFFFIPLSHPFLRTNPDPTLIFSRLSCLNIEIDVM